jgi:hypothetical protein
MVHEEGSGWEAVPDPMGLGRGWTAIRQGEDERGPFEEWCGQFFPDASACRQAIEDGRVEASDD